MLWFQQFDCGVPKCGLLCMYLVRCFLIFSIHELLSLFSLENSQHNHLICCFFPILSFSSPISNYTYVRPFDDVPHIFNDILFYFLIIFLLCASVWKSSIEEPLNSWTLFPPFLYLVCY